MAIDWTQTLMGTSTAAATGDGDAASAQEPAAALAGARLLGVLVGSLAMGLSLASLPFRTLADVLPEWIGLSGVLAASVCGFVLLSRDSAVARLAGLFSGFLVLPFAAFAGVDLPVLALLSLLTGALGLSDWLTLQGQSRPARLVAGISVFATIACFLQWPLQVAAVLPSIALAVPMAITACRRPARPAAMPAGPDAATRLRRLETLQGLLMQGSQRQVLVVDQVGAIELGLESAFGRHLVETQFPEHSVVAATLIADRVPLLQALSRAIHEQLATHELELRMRRDPAGAGFPSPPRYDVWRCQVAPLPDQPGHAAFLFEPAAASLSGQAAPAGAPRQDAALVSRALHDSIAPFNAGLGFLEMLADPRLAPRDPAAWRDFAAEAHKAISEAHRNTHLLGRWLRVGQDEGGESADILPSRLLSDAIRAMNLRDAQDKGLFRIEQAQNLPAARLPLAAARFAVEILLRRAMGRAGSRLEALRDGADLLVVCHDAPGGDPRAVDPFERALCQALASQTGIGFARTGNDDLTLRFAGAFAGRLPAPAEAVTSVDETIRLAV